MLCILYKKYVVSNLLYDDDEIVKNFITEKKNPKVVLLKKKKNWKLYAVYFSRSFGIFEWLFKQNCVFEAVEKKA